MASTNTYWLDVDPASGNGGGEVTVDAQTNTVTSDERGAQLVVKSASGLVKRISVTQDGGYQFIFDKTSFVTSDSPSVATAVACKRTVTKLAILQPEPTPTIFTLIRINFYKNSSLVLGKEISSFPWEEAILPVAPGSYDRVEVEMNYAKTGNITAGSFSVEFTFDSGPTQQAAFAVSII